MKIKKELWYFLMIWLRYVDDIFAVSDSKNFNIHDFMSLRYNRFLSIKLTFEIENKEHLTFLEVLVIRKWTNMLKFVGLFVRLLLLLDCFFWYSTNVWADVLLPSSGYNEIYFCRRYKLSYLSFSQILNDFACEITLSVHVVIE